MSKKLQIILIDNRDSFTGNLFQIFDENSHCTIQVCSYDDLKIEALEAFDKIVISPGPDIPEQYPKLFEVLNRYAGRKSILGVCLGHQTIAAYYGATLYNLKTPRHGILKELKLLESVGIFQNKLSNNSVGLYHSWAVSTKQFPEVLKVTAVDSDGIIMALRHRQFDITGLQFHPESYRTASGSEWINNWIIS